MPSGVYPRTEKHHFNKGKKHPNRKKYLKGVSVFHKICAFCKKDYVADYKNHNRSKYCSRSCQGKNNIENSLKNLSRVNREYQKEVARQVKGEKHPNWKGGTSRVTKLGYNSGDYKRWRVQVFKRDNYTCQSCGVVKVYITAHHIKSWRNYPDLRFKVNNGLTLCEPCHSKTDNYKGRSRRKTLTPL